MESNQLIVIGMFPERSGISSRFGAASVSDCLLHDMEYLLG